MHVVWLIGEIFETIKQL